MGEIATLLEDGASPRLLLETLERRSAIEPLAENAYNEVSGVLTAAIACHGPEESAEPAKADAAPASLGATVSVLVQPEVSSSAARARVLASDLAAARDALDAEERKVRDLEAALTARMEATRAATVRAEEAQRESAHNQTEVRLLRDALATRDASLAEATYALGQRDTQLTALQQEHARTVPALEARAAALAADLAVSRSALEAEQLKAQESHKILSAQLGSADAVRSRNAEAVREAELLKQELRTLQGSLAKRDAEHTELLQEHAKATRAFEEQVSSVARLGRDLQAAREHATGLAGELGAVRTELESERRRLQESHKSLSDTTATGRARAEAASREADQLRHETRLARESLKAREAEFAVRASELAALRQAHAKVERSAEASNKSIARGEAELRAERARVETLSADLATTREQATGLDAQLKLTASQLNAVRAEYDALKAARAAEEAARLRHATAPVPVAAALAATPAGVAPPPVAAAGPPAASPVSIDDSGVLLAKLASYQKEFDATDSFVARMRSDETEAPIRNTGPQPVNRDRERAARARSVEPVVSAPPPAESNLLQRARVRAARQPPAVGRAAGWGAAVLLLAVVLWAVVHHRAAQRPAAELAAPAPGTVIRDCPECPAMKVLPAARFKQGAARTDGAALAFEKPQHWVNIARPFAVSIDAVTVDEFARFIAATDRPMEGCATYDGDWQQRADGNWRNPGFVQSGRHPVTCVSFDDATAYAQWLSERTGRRYRLPSASEWEYAAGGTEAASPWGRGAESTACGHANVADQSAARRYPGWQVFPCDDGYANTAPVGSFKGNVLELDDMLGNVFQWTQDCWTADYTGAPVDGHARTDGDCTQRELRGGSWFSSPAYVRLSYRNHFAADYRTSSVGIRLVREIGP